jgi:mannose-6-phosphate isomerase-like protein (cupin superfamily)
VRSFAVLIPIIPIGLMSLGLQRSSAQEKRTAEPPPSYREDGPATLRHPEGDTNVDLYINHWRNSSAHQGPGGLMEWDILTPGDPLRPPQKGAVLKYVKAYRRAILRPRTNTAAARHENEQVFFYVSAGKGRVEAGGKTAGLEEGSAVFIPAGLSYGFSNPNDAELEMIVVVEGTTLGFLPNREMSVGSYRDSLPTSGGHWAHVTHPFLYDIEPKFSNSMGFIVVSIDNLDIAQPHTHGPGTEEIWLQLRGTSLLFFGNRLLHQEPGEALLIPPNDRVPHCSINHTGEPMLWLYMGCRREEDAK